MIAGYVETVLAAVLWYVIYNALRFNGLLMSIVAWIAIMLGTVLLVERVARQRVGSATPVG